MSLPVKSNRGIDTRFRWVAIAIIVMLLAASVLAYYLVWPNLGTGDLTEDQPIPTLGASDRSLAPTDLQSFMDNHGPWLSATEAQDLRSQRGVRNLALFRENGLVYSSQSVDFDGSEPWQSASQPPQIQGVSVRGTTTTIRTNEATFVLNISQPFVVSGNLARVFTVDAEGVLWSAPTTDLKFVQAETVANTSLPANSKLSPSIGG